MSISVDVWGGELFTNVVARESFEDWDKAAAFIKESMETGLLCNVLHSDFAIPENRYPEMEAIMAANVAEWKKQ